ncbi:MAG: hypothetical protein K0Q59_1288 [Paenibacillus sp.]|jgi:hypothetical protein|nr:hypothetical protein [Paenibacillus sp.]
MYIALAIFASVLGLFVTGAAAFTAWSFYTARKTAAEHARQGETAYSEAHADIWGWFLRWTIVDYAALLLFGFGFVFLLADLAGVMKEREIFPMYHLAYLVCGIVFCFLGMLFTITRLGLVLRLTRSSAAARHHADKPKQTYGAK